jgi:pyruvate dehydrogenase E1 component
VILAKTVKGYGMGDAGEAENDTHQVKKLDLEELKHFRDRFDIPLTDKELESIPFYRPPDDARRWSICAASANASAGRFPRRIVTDEQLEVPPLESFGQVLEGTGKRANSTTMASCACCRR